MRNPDLGQNLVRHDAVGIAGRGEAIDKNLPRAILDRIARKLRRGELHHSRRIRNFEPHRAVIGHAHKPRMPDPAIRRETQRLGADGEISQRRLAANNQHSALFKRAAEPDVEHALVPGCNDFPAQNVRAFDPEDFAGPGKLHADAGQLPLQNPEIDLRGLSQQPGSDAHVADLVARERQRANSRVPRLPPSHRGVAVGREKTFSRCRIGNDRRLGVEFHFLWQTVDQHRDDRAGGHAEIERLPLALAQRRHKFQIDRECAGLVKDQLRLAVFQLDMPAISRCRPGHRGASGKQRHPRSRHAHAGLAVQMKIHAAGRQVGLSRELGADQIGIRDCRAAPDEHRFQTGFAGPIKLLVPVRLRIRAERDQAVGARDAHVHRFSRHELDL